MKWDINKLGTYSFVTVKRGIHNITIVNAYTQFHWRGSGKKVDYEAIKEIMKKVKIQFTGKKIGIPLIWGGLAWGNWKIISSIIEDELVDEDITLVKFK